MHAPCSLKLDVFPHVCCIAQLHHRSAAIHQDSAPHTSRCTATAVFERSQTRPRPTPHSLPLHGLLHCR